MLIEQELEEKIVASLSAVEDVEIVGSRQPAAAGTVKGEHEVEKTGLVAVAVGLRSHDAFTLSPVSIPVTVAVTTRAEMDATGAAHERIVEGVTDLLSMWHKCGDEMAAQLSCARFFAGELRMDGGSGKQFDSARSAWVESVSFTIRGAERFTR